MYDNENGNLTELLATAAAVLVVTGAAIGLIGVSTMLALGAIYGYFGLLEPLGIYDSILLGSALFLFSLVFGTKTGFRTTS